MASNAHVETIFTAGLGHVFVCLNTGCFKGVGGDLFTFVRAQVSAEWKFSFRGPFVSDVVDTDFRLWYTTKVARFDVRFVLTVAVAASWSSSHIYNFFFVYFCGLTFFSPTLGLVVMNLGISGKKRYI